MTVLSLSKNLAHTWLFDVDGVLLRHNGHLDNREELLPGIIELWNKIPQHDTIVLLSSRKEKEQEATLDFLRRHGLRYNHVIFGLPFGERILFNDEKPLGLKTALAVNLKRDDGLSEVRIEQQE